MQGDEQRGRTGLPSSRVGPLLRWQRRAEGQSSADTLEKSHGRGCQLGGREAAPVQRTSKAGSVMNPKDGPWLLRHQLRYTRRAAEVVIKGAYSSTVSHIGDAQLARVW